jgi:hypothetical protein
VLYLFGKLGNADLPLFSVGLCATGKQRLPVQDTEQFT